MSEPVQSAPDDATLPGRAAASDDVTLPPAAPPRVQQRPVVSQLPARERYALGCEVARGGMGAILRATDLSIERTVAMKVVLEAAADNAEMLQRFTQEAKLTGQLEHPNIVPVHDLSFDEQGRPFYTMKFVKGVTLHDILAKLKDGDAATVAQYSLAHLLTIYQKVCDAVAFAHSNNVIHRDLKPANIMVGDYGEVLVMDWGLAKVVGGQRSAVSDQRSVGAQPGWATVSDLAHPPTEGQIEAQKTCGPGNGAVGDRRQTEVSDQSSPVSDLRSPNSQLQSPISDLPSPISAPPALTLAGAVMGSPQYMAPEQAAGELDKLDARTDIFALGGILYHILTLHPPVNGTTIPEMLQQILDGEILPPSSYHTKTGRKNGGTIKVGEKTFPRPPLIPLRHCPGGRIPESLGAVAMKALALTREDRYQNVPELQKDIEAYQGGFATGAEKASAWRQLALLVKRHKKEFALAAVATVLLLGTVTGFLVKVTKEKNRAEVNEKRAETEKAHAQTERDRAEKTLGQLHDTAPTFYAQAQVLLEQRQWSNAMEKASIAASLAPEVIEYQLLHGNLLQTALRMTEARDAYAAALQRAPDHPLAKENWELCQKFLRDTGGSQHLSSLRPIQAAMLRQGRTAEAGAFMRFIENVTTNRTELLMAWSNVLTKAGIDGRYLHYNDKEGFVFAMHTGDYTNESLAPFHGIPLNYLHIGTNSRKVRNLHPLQGMPLYKLVLGDVPLVTDLSPLQGMQLTWLEIHKASKLSDLTPLHGMPLQRLMIDQCAVTNLSPLQGMPLTYLGLGTMRVTDLTPLAGMRLTDLGISTTLVSDLSPLRGMLLKGLTAFGTPIADISPLKGMPLESLWIMNTPVKDFSPLQGMPLVALGINETSFADLALLKGMSLKWLRLSRCPITDLGPLRGMPLKDLTLNDCAKLQDLTPLADCRQLETLSIPVTCKNIECLRSHPTLKQLGFTPTNLVTVAEFWKTYDAPKPNAAVTPAIP